MAWSIVGVGTNVVVTTTGITLIEPAGAAAGDLLVASIAYRHSATTPVGLPSGWTLVGEQKFGNLTAGASTSVPHGVMAYIVRGGSAPAYGFTLPIANVGMGCVIAYRGQHTTTPVDLFLGGTTANGITAIGTAGMTTLTANDLLVAAVCMGRGGTLTNFRATTPATGSGATDTATTPSGTAWIERSDNTTTSGADVGLALIDAIKLTAGATGNFLATASLSAGHAILVGAFKAFAAALTADKGSVAVAMQVAALSATRRMSAAAGAIVVTRNAAALPVKMPAAKGAVALTGSTAGLSAVSSRVLLAATSSIVVSPKAAGLRAGYVLKAEPPSWASDFVDDNGTTSFIDDLGVTSWIDDEGLILGGVGGSITVTGRDAELVSSAAVDIVLPIIKGNIILYGASADLQYGRPPIVDPGPGPIESNRLNPGPLVFGRRLVVIPGRW